MQTDNLNNNNPREDQQKDIKSFLTKPNLKLLLKYARTQNYTFKWQLSERSFFSVKFSNTSRGNCWKTSFEVNFSQNCPKALMRLFALNFYEMIVDEAELRLIVKQIADDVKMW